MKTLINIIVLLLSALLNGCHNRDAGIKINDKQQSKFNLQTDISTLASSMTENDTVVIHADLRVCMSDTEEINILTKSGGQVFLKTVRIREDGDA